MKVNSQMELMEFLLQNLNNVSRNNIKSLLKYRQVYVNGVPQTQYNYYLNSGDEVEISKYRASEDLEILYEDEYLIAINKPANILSVRNNKGEYSAISMVLKHFDDSNIKDKAFVLHRLDKATSGVFMVAKSEKIQKQMQESWNEIVKKRGYYAIVDGKIKENGRIVSNLIEHESGMVFSTHGEGKEAITNYKVLEKREHCTLLDINIETGRKNQIRVHMKEMGHPILGDLKYSEKSKFASRLCLHAYELKFLHPVSEKMISVKAPRPVIFNKVLNNSKKLGK